MLKENHMLILKAAYEQKCRVTITPYQGDTLVDVLITDFDEGECRFFVANDEGGSLEMHLREVKGVVQGEIDLAQAAIARQRAKLVWLAKYQSEVMGIVMHDGAEFSWTSNVKVDQEAGTVSFLTTTVAGTICREMLDIKEVHLRKIL